MQRRAAPAPPPPRGWSAAPPGRHSLCVGVHADNRTLVALCADLRACGAAMPAAVSVVATCAAGHCLSIIADSSGAALFCIASRRQSDEDTADHRLGGGKPRVNPTPCVCSAMRLIDTSILFCTSPPLQGRPCHAAVSCGWAQELVRPSTPCDPFGLGASTVRCTTTARQSHRVGPYSPPQPGSATRRQLHGIARPTRINEGCFCPPGRQSSTAAEDRWVPRTHTAQTAHTSPLY
ncbi:hypothetical protein TcYC6_0058310 [Trypanosoma cruzi]|nr:hypothetical protein TcYC6_0015000 [Trypanosoma cruzi]KAF8300643.1 hypothetical protein TcYC6_0058310 [Trypanosoma cruzi]RNC57583.1 hypothetical protein TcCL_ESM04892 [Trypanosoma cruzi]